MSQDVPAETFFNQIGNTTVRAILTTNATLPSAISPSSFVLSLVDGLEKAQIVFNAANGSLPNVATVSGKEISPIVVSANGKIGVPIFYSVGGTLFVDASNSDPIIL